MKGVAMNAAQQYKDRLARSQGAWIDGQKKAETMFKPKDPGDYRLQLQGITLADRDIEGYGNQLIANVEWNIIEGVNGNEGETIYESMWLEGEKSAVWVANWFNTLGFAGPENYEDLPEMFEELVAVAPIVDAKVTVTSDERYNRMRIRDVEIPEGAADGGDAEATPEEQPAETEPEATPEEQPSEEQPTEEENPDTQPLLALGESFGLDVSGYETHDAMVADFTNYDWDFTQLSKDEVELLERNGVGHKIKNRPEVKKDPPKRTLAKTTAKTTAKRGGGLKKK